MSTSTSSSDARAARRARRSLCTARVWSGVNAVVAASLASDDETFFGSDVDVDSDVESAPASPAAKLPCLADTWESGSSSSDLDVSQVLSEEEQSPESDTDVGDSLEDVQTRIATGCNCHDRNHFTVLSAKELLHVRSQMSKMKKKEKDSFVLGVLSAGVFSDAQSHGRTATSDPRKRVKFDYKLFGHGACRSAILYAFKIGPTHLKRLQKLAGQNLCSPNPHANLGGQAWNMCAADDRKRVSQFITNYATVNGLPMPAAPRGRAHSAPTYLPASDTYVSVHADYCKAQQEGEPTVSISTFKRIWKTDHPDIKFMSPREDVCGKCEQFRNNLRTMWSEGSKRELSEKWMQHIDLATSERVFYNDCLKSAKEDADTVTHITFDYSENFGIPYHSRQPGPVYFKVLLRMNDFGIINEAIPEQVHHIYHEGQTIGADNSKAHGPNNVISMLHHYLATHPHAQCLHAHCDNCCGQNKNKSVMAYFCWRVMVGLEKDINVSFMVVGHTRCSVDGGFGLAKKKFRCSDCDTPEQLSATIDASAEQNKACLYEWQWRNWDAFLSQKFRRLSGITKFQHFRFSSEFPGSVKVKETVDGPETTFKLATVSADSLVASDLPEVLPAGGITEDRKAYLVKHVLEFCRPENRDAFKEALG